LAKTKLGRRVRRQEVFEFLRRCSRLERFQIIFADPPYEKTKSGERFTEKLLTNKELARLLEFDGVFVLEKRPAEQTPATKFWDIVRARKYGASEGLFLRRPPSASMTWFASSTICSGHSGFCFFCRAICFRFSVVRVTRLTLVSASGWTGPMF